MKYLYFLASIKQAWLTKFALLSSGFMVSILLISCSGTSLSSGSSGGTASSGASPFTSNTAQPQASLSQLHWCGKPLQIFRDEGATTSGTPTVGTPTAGAAATATPTTLTQWSQVEPQLGFTVYLPATLPDTTCLVSVSGTIHDPLFGSSFTIGYLLPDHSSLSLSEAPLRSHNTTFQCTVSTSTGSSSTLGGTPTKTTNATPIQLCTGIHDRTNIVLSAPGTTSSLQQLFNSLQAQVAWEPTS